ncbi:MAG: arylsulfotransferase family protein [Gemmataceae bacterium]
MALNRGVSEVGAGAASPPAHTPSGPPRRNLLASCLSLFGLASFCYLLGAAVIFFDLPSSTFLRRAFLGGVTWYEQRGSAPVPEKELPPITVSQLDNPDKTCDGFTLCMYGGDSQAVLIDRNGETVHRWHVPFSQLWSAPPHVRGRIEDASVYFNDGHVYPNGDLLAVIEGPINLSNSSNGYGLVKLDKNSRVLWKYAANCHHDLDVAEDGAIYVLVNETIEQVPPALAYIPTPCMVDCVDVISPEGKRKKRISLLEGLLDSPFAALFSTLQRPKMSGGTSPQGVAMPASMDDALRRDVLHANAIKVLNPALAPKFPLFKAGQLLTSLRHLDALAVLDPDSGKVVWAARGPWHAQHDPTFLDTGHLLLFDNRGSPLGSRVLEYDPRTQAFPWDYPGAEGKPFLSKIRGMAQRLPNGNTLIVNSDGGEVFEVSPGRKVVWTCNCGPVELYRARRYTPEQLPFLKELSHDRP